MKIADLTISNFRGIKKGRVIFGDHTVFVGPNNTGKTTIIEALALLLGKERLVRTLTEHDFNGSNPKPESRIQLIATITDFSPNDHTAHVDWFRDDRAVPKWFDKKTGEIHATKKTDDCFLCAQIGFLARFDFDTLSVESARYFHDDDSYSDIFEEDSYTPLSGKLMNELGFFMVPASRTWDKMISFASELFRGIVKTIGGIPSEVLLSERDRLRSPGEPIEEDSKIKELIGNVNKELSGLFSVSPKLKLRITATDSESLFQAVTPHYQFDNGPTLPSYRQGTGLTSLQSLMLLLQFGRLRSQEGKSFCLAVEEPEIHVPPALQMRLIYRLHSLCTQTITCTHSPIVAAFYEPTEIVLLQNRDGILTANKFLNEPITLQEKNSIRKLYQINRQEVITALMHEVVLVPEGRTDYDLLSLLLKASELTQDKTKIDDIEFSFGTFIGLIPTQNASVVDTYEKLQDIHQNVYILVDGDSSGNEYIKKLCKSKNPPSIIMRWGDSKSIEHVIGWILSADAAFAITEIKEIMDNEPLNIDDIIVFMSKKSNEGGIKSDMTAYELIASIISENDKMMERCRQLLNSIVEVSLGSISEENLFVKDDASTMETSIHVFKL